MLAENGQRQSVSGCDKETTEELCVRAPAALQALGQLLLKSHIKKQKTNYFVWTPYLLIFTSDY